VVNKPTDNVTGISSASFDETNFFKWKTFISRKFFHRIEHQYPHIKLKELHIVPRFGKENEYLVFFKNLCNIIRSIFLFV